MCWALLFFRCGRFRANLEAGHALATGEPFGIVRRRYRVYMGRMRRFVPGLY